MGQPMDGAVFLGIGLPMGNEIIKTNTSRPLRAGIRRGGQWISAPLEAWNLWVQTLYPQSLQNLKTWGLSNNFKNIDESVEDMEELGLVVRWDKNTGASTDMLCRLRVIPLAMGMGNSADHPDQFEIASTTARSLLLTVDLVDYSLWSFFDGYTSLYDACVNTARHLGISVDYVLSKAAHLLPALMSVRAAYIDLIPDGAQV